MNPQPTVAVIIPTYNRAAMLHDTLTALAQQTYPFERLEIIVVDDGSVDETEQVVHEHFPFHLHYLRQQNRGDAAARNIGVRHTEAEMLIFLDDDIVVAREFLRHIVAGHGGREKRIISGTEYSAPGDQEQPTFDAGQGVVPLDFVDLCSNNMGLSRHSYLAIGEMDNLGFSGSSIWCDVDFAFRAHNQHFEFVRSCAARYWHRDYVKDSLSNETRRIQEAAYRAATLFQKHPGLLPHLPMFEDKTAIAWHTDSPTLVVRKLIRPVASSQPVLAVLEHIALALEPRYASHSFFAPLCRWIIGAHIYHGYRRGQREVRQLA